MFQLLLGITFLCFSGVFCEEGYDNYNGRGPAVAGPAYPGPGTARGIGRAPVGSDYTGAIDFCVSSAEDPDADCIPGQAGADYPVYDQIPPTGFACQSHPYPGYFADPAAGCQVFHICQHDGRQDSFLCPKGTIFNQQYFVCDWWYNFDCGTATNLYGLNTQLYQEPADGPYRNGYGPQIPYGGPAAPYPAPAAHPPVKAPGY